MIRSAEMPSEAMDRTSSNTTRLVGREGELAPLVARMEEHSGNAVEIVLVAGEPGVGKTRLMQEVAQRARELDWRVLWGASFDSEATLPYQPFVEALEEYVAACPTEELIRQLGDATAELALIVPSLAARLPNLPEGLPSDPQISRYRLFESVGSFLSAIAATGHGLLLCLDDLHWADDASLQLLEHIARRTADARLLILVSYRDTDLDVGHPFARTLEQFTRQHLAQRLDLNRLDKRGLTLLLAELGRSDPPARLVDAMYVETEGNPFFVQEVFLYLLEEGRLLDERGHWRRELSVGDAEVPQGVRLVIGRRLERLSEVCRRLLATGAVLGRSFDFNLLKAIESPDGTGSNENELIDALEEAERAHLLITDAGGRVTFSHELLRQTLLAGLSALRRQRIHLRAANAIEEIYASNLEPHVAELADHFSQIATEPAALAKALAYTLKAADHSFGIYAYSDAARLYERAIEMQQQLDPEDKSTRCDLLTRVIAPVAFAGDPERAVGAGAIEAFQLAEAMADIGRAERVCLEALAALSFQAAGWGIGRPQYVDWIQRLDRVAGPRSEGRVAIDFHPRREDAQESFRLRGEGLALARELNNPAILARAALMYLILFAPVAGQFELAGIARECAQLDAASLPKGVSGPMLSVAGFRLMEWGARDEALALWQRARDLAERIRAPQVMGSKYIGSIILATIDGRLNEAVALRDEYVEIAAANGNPIQGMEVGGFASGAYVYLGRADEAQAHLRGHERALGYPDGSMPGHARYLAHMGKRDEARASLRAVRADPSSWRDFMHKIVGQLEAAVILEERGIAAELAELLRPLSAVLDIQGCTGSIARVLGDAEALMGNAAAARSYYEEALEACAKVSFRPEIALTRLHLGELLLQAFPGEHSAAMEHLDFVIEEAEAMGMAPALQQAVRLRGRRRPAAEPKESKYPDGLSEREIAVLRLVAMGMSNQAIADELVISLNTVRRHVSNIFDKAGLRNRAEAGVYAQRNNLT
jgi:DNA-binding CsgD family transcriptional regulator